MDQKAFFKSGCIRQLPQIVEELGAKQIFLVTGKSSFLLSGAKELLDSLLDQFEVSRFCEFEQNPKLDDLVLGLHEFKKKNFDAIVALGGGSVLDMAKLVRIVAPQYSSPQKIVEDSSSIVAQGVPLIAIPTTSGSGSESTHFAVLYIDTIKYSVAHESILPDIALIDPMLSHSMTPYLTAVSGFDAFCQAIESYWSVNSTPESKKSAGRAISIIVDNIEEAVKTPNSSVRKKMAEAANLAGKAINITKTTAPHAVSYTLTAHFGIPHGQAVGLTLGEFLVFNSQVSDIDVSDPRGASYVKKSIDEICELMNAKDPESARMSIQNLMMSVGLEISLKELNIFGKMNHNLIVKNVNPERLSNNPRQVTGENLTELLEKIDK